MFVFLKCVAEAAAEKGLRGLAGMVPGGPYAIDVARGALERYRARRNAAEMRADIQQLAQASFEVARKAGAEAAKDADATPEDRLSLELFLTQIPGAARQSLKRSDDPLGLTVPAAFALNTPDDVLKLLPPRPPKFRPGDPLPGKPGWELVEPLGTGGFGEVWLARHPRMASLAGAVKFCHRDQVNDLRHEGGLIDRVMAQGEHPNVVPLVDVHLDGETPWLMFKYVAGGDLGDVIHEWRAAATPDRVKNVVAALRELAAAVGRFHALSPSVVHRDLKPSNILRDRATGQLRITDFGIGAVTAKAALAEETRGETTRGGRLLSYLRGSYTPLYSSPQQRDGADPDPRDDVHALGVIGYQMLTGNLSQGAGPDFADDLRDAGAGEDLIALLGRCVAQKADRRPKDARELAEALSAPQPLPPYAGPFDVILRPGFDPAKKIALIKAVRELTGCDLAAGKWFVENAPDVLPDYPTHAEAERAALVLSAAGATVDVVPAGSVTLPPLRPAPAAHPLETTLKTVFNPERAKAVETAHGCGCAAGLLVSVAGAAAAVTYLPPIGAALVVFGIMAACVYFVGRLPVK